MAEKTAQFLDDLPKSFAIDKEDPYLVLERELGPKVREYRQKWEETGKGRLKVDYPIHINFELKYGCNLKCEYCIFHLPKDEWYYEAKPGGEITFEKFCEIVDDGVKRGLYSIAFNGYNEPLLRKDLCKYIRYAKQAGVIDINMHTNGMLLTEDRCQELIDSGLTIIMFSLDAINPETAKVMRVGANLEKITKHIHKFLEIREKSGSKLPLVKVSFVENKYNQDELEPFIAYWKDKVDYFTVQSFFNPFVGTSKYKEAEEKYRLKSTPFFDCAEPFQRVMITSDGEVIPCCSTYGLEMSMGSIYKDSLYNIWNGAKMKALQANVNNYDKQPESCRKCRNCVVSPDEGTESGSGCKSSSCG